MTGIGNVQEELRCAWNFVKTQRASEGLARASALVDGGHQCSEVFELQGMALAMLHRNTEARRAFGVATRMEPSRVSAHHNFAIFLANTGELDEAAEECGTVLLLQPNHAGALKLRTWVSTRIRDLRYTAEQGFAAVGSGPDVTHNPNSVWNNVECTSCGDKNHFSSRTCKRCGNMLPEMPELRCRE